jgi:hypothetical protein
MRLEMQREFVKVARLMLLRVVERGFGRRMNRKEKKKRGGVFVRPL